MKNIGMLVAVEMSAVLGRYGSPMAREQAGGFSICRYGMDGYTLYVVNSGVGELAAAAAVQLLVDRYDVELIVNFGVVGGLCESMGESHTCIVERVVHYDFDLSEIDPVEPGRYPGYDSVFIPLDEGLIQRARVLHPELKGVTCASADKFVGAGAKKRALHEQFGAEICDMEAAGVALTCARNAVPCLMIKTVSDGVDSGPETFYAQVRRSADICLETADSIIRAL